MLLKLVGLQKVLACYKFNDSSCDCFFYVINLSDGRISGQQDCCLITKILKHGKRI